MIVTDEAGNVGSAIPQLDTADKARSHVKVCILDCYKINFRDKTLFTEWKRLWKGFFKCTVYCGVLSVQCTVDNVECTVYRVKCTV